jgi:hypothetical protein
MNAILTNHITSLRGVQLFDWRQPEVAYGGIPKRYRQLAGMEQHIIKVNNGTL